MESNKRIQMISDPEIGKYEEQLHYCLNKRINGPSNSPPRFLLRSFQYPIGVSIVEASIIENDLRIKWLEDKIQDLRNRYLDC